MGNKPIRAPYHIPFKSVMNELRLFYLPDALQIQNRFTAEEIDVLVKAIKKEKCHWGWD